MIKDMAAGESGDEVWFLNRTVVVVRHREPFRDWARNVEEGAAEAYDSGGGWADAYLIPEFDMEEEAWEWLQLEYSTIFEIELGAWYEDPEKWPEDRTWDQFRDWFDLELIETAWDLVDEPLSSTPPGLEPGAAH